MLDSKESLRRNPHRPRESGSEAMTGLYNAIYTAQQVRRTEMTIAVSLR